MQKPRQPQTYAPNTQLREERQKRGWSRVYIAEQIGVADPKTIGRWERGKAFPSAHFLQKLCELFQMPAASLGLWQCQGDGANATLAALQTWDEILASLSGDLGVPEHGEAVAHAIPVRIGTRSAWLLIDHPRTYAESMIDVLQER